MTQKNKDEELKELHLALRDLQEYIIILEAELADTNHKIHTLADNAVKSNAQLHSKRKQLAKKYGYVI